MIFYHRFLGLPQIMVFVLPCRGRILVGKNEVELWQSSPEWVGMLDVFIDDESIGIISFVFICVILAGEKI